MNKKDLTKYIHAFTLGDGSLTIDYRELEENSNPKAWFSTVKTEVNKDFIDYTESILSELTRIRINYCLGTNGTKPYYRLNTMRHPMYTDIRNRMYIENVKRVDPHYLTLMDWETLAILYMDDGTTYVAKDIKPYGKMVYHYPKTRICTHSFSYGDNLVLAEAIKEKLDIHFYVRHENLKSGTKYFLELSRKDSNKFVDGITQFTLPSFYYKLEKFSMTSSEKSDGDIV